MSMIDVCIEVLNQSEKPLSTDQIYYEIVNNNLYQFGAKDPKSILRGTIRKHIRNNQKPRIIEVSKGVYRKA